MLAIERFQVKNTTPEKTPPFSHLHKQYPRYMEYSCKGWVKEPHTREGWSGSLPILAILV